MNARAIPILVCVIAGPFIYEVKAKDLTRLSLDSRPNANNYVIGERQRPIGVMDLDFDENDLFGREWHRGLRLKEDDDIDFDGLLLNDRFPGNANRGVGPWRGLEGFNLYTNRPGANKTDFYNMIFDTSAMNTFPYFVERGHGLGYRDTRFAVDGPWARAYRTRDTVPEPMVVSLVVISGAGLLLTRRMFRKF